MLTEGQPLSFYKTQQTNLLFLITFTFPIPIHNTKHTTTAISSIFHLNINNKMVLSWTRRNVFRHIRKVKKEKFSGADLELEEEITIPSHFRCPVSLDLMKDPVTLPTGITYDRGSIEKWIESGNKTCPVTNQPLTTTFDIIPNHSLRKMIQNWCVENTSYGIERIPTPRIPISKHEVTEVCSRLLSAVQRGDEKRCQEFVGKIRVWGRESERNKKIIVNDKACCSILSTAFDLFSSSCVENHVVVLEEILEVLTWMIPFEKEELQSQSQHKLGSSASLNCMVWFLDGKDLGARQNAALLLKEVVDVVELGRIEGVVEGLVKIVKEPIIGSNATKACLVTIFKLVSLANNREEIGRRLVELGIVSLLLETIVDAEKGICEKALGVLDCICDCKEGKEVIKMNDLTLPLVIKKILRVSPLGTSFAVSILRKMCGEREEGVLIEAVQLGAFQKLLVVLQVGCEDGTKENATELLKLLNGYRSKAECSDSLDFKHLKKSF